MKKRIMCLTIMVMVLMCHITLYAKTYEYDDLNRVTKVVYDDGSYATYEYDRNGNILKIEVFDKDGKKVEEETTSKKQEETTEKKPEETTGKKPEEATEKKPEETTGKKPEETTKKKPAETTSKKQEETTNKKYEEMTANNQEESTKNKHSDTADKKQADTTNNNHSEIIKNKYKVADPFANIRQYMSKKNNDTNNKGTFSINNGSVNSDEVILKFELKVENYLKKIVKKICDWIILYSIAD